MSLYINLLAVNNYAKYKFNYLALILGSIHFKLQQTIIYNFVLPELHIVEYQVL